MMTLKCPPSPCSSKPHKYDSYDHAPYIVSSYHYSHKINLKEVLTYPLPPPPDWTNSLPLSQHTNKGMYAFSKSLTYN